MKVLQAPAADHIDPADEFPWEIDDDEWFFEVVGKLERQLFYSPAQPRDDKGRWSKSGAAGSNRIEDGGKHLEDIVVPYGVEGVNVYWEPNDYQIDWGERKGEWVGGYWLKPNDQLRLVDPDERHLTQDITFPPGFVRSQPLFPTDAVKDTSPPNAPGASKRAMKYWSTEGSAEGREKGGIPHQSLIQKGAERLLGMPERPSDTRTIYGRRSEAEYDSMAQGILKSIHNGEPSQPTLWRGVTSSRGVDASKSNAAQLRAMKPGDEFDVPLMSTSRDVNAAMAYGRTIIRIAPGSKGYANRDHFPHDQEVITSGRFRVTRVDPFKVTGDRISGDTEGVVVSVEQVGTWLPKP